MVSFLQDYYISITRFCEIFSICCGVLTFKKFKHTPIRYFIFYLMYSFIVEMGGSIQKNLLPGGVFADYEYLRKYPFFFTNYWWYNLFWTIGSVIFWAFFYQKIITNNSYRQLLNNTMYVFVICVSLYTSFHINMFFNTALTFNKLLGSVVILMAIIFYFLSVLQSDIILTFYKSIYFYISMALFFWWILTMPPYFYEQFVNIEGNSALFYTVRLIRLSTNIFMYTTFGLALLFCKPEKPLAL